MAAKVVANPVAVLGLRTKDFTSGLSSAISATKSFASNFTSSIGSALGTVAKFSGIGGLIAGAIGSISLGALVSGQMDAIDSTAKLSDRLGITTESLIGLQHAANLAGVSNEKLTNGVGHLLKNMADAANGGKETGAAFKALGLDAKDLIGLPTDQAFGKIGDALKGIENPAQRAALVTKVFGKSGQELLPLLAEGSAGLAAMSKETRALGLSFTRIEAAKVEEANDAISRAKSVFVGVGRQIAVAIAPGVKYAADLFTSFGIKVVTVVRNILPPLVSAVGRVFALIQSALAPAFAWVQTNFAAIVGFISENLAVVGSYFYNVLSGVASLVASFVTTVYGLFDWMARQVVAGVSVVLTLFGVDVPASMDKSNSAASMAASAFLWLRDQVVGAMQVVGYSVKNWQLVVEIAGLAVAHSVVKVGNQIAYVFTEVIPSLLSWFSGNWREVFTDILNVNKVTFENMATNAQNFFTALWSWMKGDGFNFTWTGLLDGFESTIKELPKIAEREVGALEGALAADLAASQGKYFEGLGEEIASQKRLADDIKNGITNATKDVTANVSAPSAPGVAFDDSLSPDEKQKKQKAEKSGGSALDTNIVARSAESLALRDAMIRAPQESDPTPAAADPATETPKAIREKADEYQPKLIALVERLLAEFERFARDGGGTSETEVVF